MIRKKNLASALASVTDVRANKQGNAFTSPVDQPIDSAKLQEIIGDPDTHRTSWSAQFSPSTGGIPENNPLSPTGGDDAFYSGLMDGARFQAMDGSWWDIESYDWEGVVSIRNVWYPRIQKVCSIQEIRSTIHSWIEPFTQRVPPMPAGVDYGTLNVRVVD